MSAILQAQWSAVLRGTTDKTYIHIYIYIYNSSIFQHASVNSPAPRHPPQKNINNNGCYRGRRESILNISIANLVIQHLHYSTSSMTRSVKQLSKWVTDWEVSLINKFSNDSRRHLLAQRKETALLPLILQSFDWLAAFHLELLQAILSIAV
jgi:hypothetical protein